MRILATILGVVLGATLWLTADRAMAREAAVPDRAGPVAMATLDAPAAAQPVGDAEAAQYEVRQAQSPEVQEFRGGEVVVFISVFGVFVVLLLFLVLLSVAHEVH